MWRSIKSVLVVLLMCAASQAQMRFQRDFSADVVSNAPIGHEYTSRFYASKNRTRSETLKNGQVIGAMIIDYQNRTAWKLLTQHKVAMDMSTVIRDASAILKDVMTGAPPDPNNPCASLRNYSCRKLGSEDINGRHTQKWAMKDNQQGDEMTVWIDPSLPLAIRTQSKTFSGEFRNIKEGPQSDSLFQVPADYQKRPSTMPGMSSKE